MLGINTSSTERTGPVHLLIAIQRRYADQVVSKKHHIACSSQINEVSKVTT